MEGGINFIEKIGAAFESPEKKARTVEVKALWSEFTDWRGKNQELEEELMSKLPEDKGKEAMFKEEVMVFYFGVATAKGWRENLVEKPEISEVKLVTDEEKMASYDASVNTEGVKLNAGIFTLNPETLGRINRVVIAELYKYYKEQQKSVSQNLTDLAFLSLFATGIEEYAHATYIHAKQGQKLVRAFNEYNLIENMYQNNKQDELYSSSDLERRALVWQENIFRKKLPHWSESLKVLVEKTRAYRLNRSGKLNK